MADIAHQVGALQLPLGIAGGGHPKVPAGPDVAHQLAGVLEVGFWGIVRVHVSPKSQHILHPVRFQIGQQAVHVLPPGGHAGEVGHGGDVVLVLDEGGNVPGGLVHLGASRPEGDADKVGPDILQAVQRLVDAVNGIIFLWGEHLAGKDGFSLAE